MFVFTLWTFMNFIMFSNMIGNNEHSIRICCLYFGASVQLEALLSSYMFVNTYQNTQCYNIEHLLLWNHETAQAYFFIIIIIIIVMDMKPVGLDQALVLRISSWV
jgi:hypothetical protein